LTTLPLLTWLDTSEGILNTTEAHMHYMGMFQVKKFDKHGVLDIKFQQLNSREDSSM
jgi:hypothetical protein